MKDLITFINEMGLKELGKYIKNDLQISYDQAHKVLSKYNNKYDDDEFEELLSKFIESKDFGDNNNRVVNIINKLLGLDETNKQFFIEYFSKRNEEQYNIGLPISNIFNENTIFSNNIYNIFNKIIESISAPNDKNFKDSLIKLAKETLPGGQAAGQFELLLALCIAGKVAGKGDVGMAINGSTSQNLQIEVKYCNGCNFKPYKGVGLIETSDINYLVDNINNIINNKLPLHYKYLVYIYIDCILTNKIVKYNSRCESLINNIDKVTINNLDDVIETLKSGKNDSIIKNDDIIDFLDIYFNSDNTKQTVDETYITNSIAIYLIHHYLLNQFKNENIDYKYLILFKHTKSISNGVLGNYIYVDANKYQNNCKNKDTKSKTIKDLIEFFNNNLKVRTINKGNIEINFKTNKKINI